MDPGWTKALTADERRELSDTGSLLQRLHGVSAELAHVNTVLVFVAKFGSFALETFQKVEASRELSGHPRVAEADEAEFREAVLFELSRADFCRDRTEEIRERARSQISVVGGVLLTNVEPWSASMLIVNRSTVLYSNTTLGLPRTSHC